ncbi:MAG TPA: ATP-binding cassette domain-containing protein [Candidatus Manganitrophaceae bacterium]|nr:ATP-binding cassette domain-containing protein [Candidatus Manganitrophaceae bacterium]
MIKIDHLTKEYASGRRAIQDITFQVTSGEIFGFLGPNGAGKTTTIKILTTLLRPTSGSAVVSGYNVVENPLAVRMSFGYVGQQSGVDPALTVRENLLLQGRLYHLAPSTLRERISFLLDLFDLNGAADMWVGALSGGMKRKLDIGAALIHQPRLLFLDEPTLGLDPQSRSDLWAYIRRLNREQGVTLFLTTHYLDEVDQLASRVGILDLGRIQAIGTPDQLKDSLGADCIHLSFKQPLSDAHLAFFRGKEPIKEVIRQEDRLRLYLQNGRATLPKVLQWVDEQGLTAETVVLTRPTFDDVFLKYTGKSLEKENTKEIESSSSWGGGWGKKWGDQQGDGQKEWEKWKKEDAAEGSSAGGKAGAVAEPEDTAPQKEWPQQKDWPKKDWKEGEGEWKQK